MRIFVLIMLVAIGSSAATFLIVSSQKNAENDNEIANLEEKNAKEKQQTAANKRKVRKSDGTVKYIETKVKEPTTPATSPEEFIERLETVNIADKGSQRRVVHYMESLVDMGPNSLPAIRAYLQRNVDKDYLPDRTQLFGSNTNAGPRGGGEAGRAIGTMAADFMARYDKDGDGKIDDNERNAMREEMRERFQGFGGAGGFGGGEFGGGKGGRGSGRKGGEETNPKQ